MKEYNTEKVTITIDGKQIKATTEDMYFKWYCEKCNALNTCIEIDESRRLEFTYKLSDSVKLNHALKEIKHICDTYEYSDIVNAVNEIFERYKLS